MKSISTTEVPRLAAILAIDVVGYSRLMRNNETQTLTNLKAIRTETIDPIAANYHGRLFKTMGDGFLLEFGSVTNAVQCAVDIQKQVVARNSAGVSEQTLEFRMGLNVADIIPDQDDVFGDGVNIAARLEALAEPSGICISGAVYEQIKHTYGDLFKSIGPNVLKNIETPIEVYALDLDKNRTVSLWVRLSRFPYRTKLLLIAGAIAFLAAGAGVSSIIGIGSHVPVNGDAATINANHGTASDPNAGLRDDQTEAQEIEATAENEAAKAKAKATVATAKAEADAATAEAKAKAQVLKRAVDAWRDASLALTEATEHLREVETQIAELKARLVAIEESRSEETNDDEKAQTLDALQQRLADAEEELNIVQARYDAAVKTEQTTKAHMERQKADTSSAGEQN